MAQYKGAASEAGRAMHLMKKREKQREQMEQMKQRIAEENIMKSNIDKKFSAHYDAVEAELKSSTVGLVTLNDMKAKQEALVKEREKQLAKKEQSKELQLKLEKLREKERKKEAKRKISSLSFTLEEEEEAGEEEEEVAMDEEELEREEITTKKRKMGKNPDVDTSFLPDRDREEEENRLREELRQEWEAKQEKIKSEEIEITFSYWDGSGHRRTVKMKKGNTMQQFLQKALEILRKDFSELRSAGVEQLMYIKEDLIIPHGPSSILMFTMMCGCSVTPPWRRMSRTQARWCCGAGMRKISISSPPAAGSPMTPRRSGTSTRSDDLVAMWPLLPAVPSSCPQDSRHPAPHS
ncbi:protein FAM50A isoform X1 [Moschus berezovskii]|uniref:protein FAM50A isoform X1 n=1 Tax=Moschus berezovskii TaxID=68408 RepID=UPI002445387E|nr:protein FAM50A isoform X1 [Moschus berezovskii]